MRAVETDSHDPTAIPEMENARVWAVSDLHVAHPDNKAIVERLRPAHQDDWLLVAGDVGEMFEDVAAALELLSDRFAKVIWTPGNHELWTHPKDPVTLRGEYRYRGLVETLPALGVHTPEDPYPVWNGAGRPDGDRAAVRALRLHLPAAGRPRHRRGLAIAEAAGIVCTDQFLLHPDPHPSREDWCRSRVAYTEAPARRAGPRPADDPGQPLPAGPDADQDPALPGVRPVVRHRGHRRLAQALQRHRHGLRTPAHPAPHGLRQRALHRGLPGLPARVEPAPAGRSAAPDPAAASAGAARPGDRHRDRGHPADPGGIGGDAHRHRRPVPGRSRTGRPRGRQTAPGVRHRRWCARKALADLGHAPAPSCAARRTNRCGPTASSAP